MDLYDYDEREKETDGMELVIDEIIFEIPEELVQERMDLFKMDRQNAIEYIKDSLSGYLACFSKTETNTPEFKEKAIDWLNGETDIFKPDTTFQFDPVSGFLK